MERWKMGWNRELLSFTFYYFSLSLYKTNKLPSGRHKSQVRTQKVSRATSASRTRNVWRLQPWFLIALSALIWQMSRATSLALLHVCGGTKCIEKYEGIIMWLCPAVRILNLAAIGKPLKIVLEAHWAEVESFTVVASLTHLPTNHTKSPKLSWQRNPLLQ